MRALFFLFIIILFLVLPRISFAQSSYVLPYPSVMQGSLSYRIHLIYESVSKYWYFGNFGQFNYNLKMADKYLVEAKTLFEYKQYLLGYKALKKSDKYFIKILPNLVRAEKNGKNILQKKAVFDNASLKHMEVLQEIKNTIPSIFIWEPEKSIPTNLKLREAINLSIQLRNNKL